MFTLLRHTDGNGTDVFGEWLSSWRDLRAKAKILVRPARLEAGNFGDCKNLQEGVSELRINRGPGYRVYFARVGDKLVVLVGGGDKRTQKRDIENAVARLADFQRRKA